MAQTKKELSTSSLTAIFGSHKEQIAKRLQSYSLPRDSKTVQAIVVDSLSELFESDGLFRQSLTQSEDYILQSAILLLKSQQDIAAEIASAASTFTESPIEVTSPNANSYNSVIGSGIGGTVGGLLGGAWGAVFGAIAGTAIVVYLATRTKESSVDSSTNTINVDTFISIVSNICESIDNLIETYRTQVQRIKQTYEQKEVPTLQNTYSELLDKIADTISVVKNESVSPKVSSAIDMLASSLENYDLAYVNGRIVRCN